MIRLTKLIFMILFSARVSFAMDGSIQVPDYSLLDWLAPSSYSYNPEGLMDPFVPFIQARINEVQEPERPARPLTPLERLEIGQLRLVGVLQGPHPPHSPAAMVELPDGKGFILQEGFRVGTRRGKVIKILPDRIIVREHIQGDFGRSEEVQRILKLRSEDGE